MQISNLRQSTKAVFPNSDLPLGRVWQANFPDFRLQTSDFRCQTSGGTASSPLPTPHSPLTSQVCFWPRRSARRNQVRFWPASRPHLAPELDSGISHRRGATAYQESRPAKNGLESPARIWENTQCAAPRFRRRLSMSPRRAAGGKRRQIAAKPNYHILAPTRKQGGIHNTEYFIADESPATRTASRERERPESCGFPVSRQICAACRSPPHPPLRGTFSRKGRREPSRRRKSRKRTWTYVDFRLCARRPKCAQIRPISARRSAYQQGFAQTSPISAQCAAGFHFRRRRKSRKRCGTCGDSRSPS
jgi:hypothetical protein